MCKKMYMVVCSTPYGGKLRPRGGRAAMDSAAAGGSSVLSRLGTVPAKSPAGSGDVWYKVLVSGFVRLLLYVLW